MTIPLVRREIIPDAFTTSLRRYARYPKQKIIKHSATGLLLKDLAYFSRKALSRPNRTPTKSEEAASITKSMKM